MTWAAALPAILGLVLALLQLWSAKAPQRIAKGEEDAKQQGRQDIANGNADAVSTRIDGLCSQASGNSPGLSDDEDTKRRLAKITGV